MRTTIILILLFLSVGCQVQIEKPTFILLSQENLLCQGRIDFLKDGKIALISPGAFINIHFSGAHCEVFLKSELEPYSYVSFELDGEYLGRQKIESDTLKPYTIAVNNSKNIHSLKIIKETEAGNGSVLISGVKVNALAPFAPSSKKYIEFIGNSITCGAASDSSVIPCDEGIYFDHQNVYDSYGVRLSRLLDVDYMLSAVSGIGIYRNWNEEAVDVAIMPKVYENLYLNTDASKKFDFSKKPAIVSICLGTNDFSNGDGIHPRAPFNQQKFIENYIQFVETVVQNYPTTTIVLLSSPTVGGAGRALLMRCLETVQDYFKTNFNRAILVYEFEAIYNQGCSYHPSVAEHGAMAQELAPFFKDILSAD